MEVVTSQVVAYGTIACIQAALLTIFGIYVVNVSAAHTIVLINLLVQLKAYSQGCSQS